MPNSNDPNNNNAGWPSAPGQHQQPQQPAQPQYQQQYQQPAQPQYQQPAQPQQQYQQPAQPQYQQPAQPQYQQPAQQQYQQPAQQQYQQPAAQQYQQPAQQQYQQPGQPQYQQQYQQPAPPQYQAAASQVPGQAPAQQAQAFGGHGGGPSNMMGGVGGGFQRQVPSGAGGVGAARLQFIRRTYLHLTGAIFLFAGLTWLLMTNETMFKMVTAPVIEFALFGGQWNWLIFIGLFVGVGYIADRLAQSNSSKKIQYAGLGLYVVAEAIIFLPLLFVAEVKGQEIMASGGGDPHFIRDAAYLTLGLFGALTASVFVTKKDFSFMRSGLMMAGVGSMILIVIAIVGGFNLGIIFSFAMVALAAGYTLYYTSQVLAHYHTESYVAASLALFSAVALMFWYVIRILISLRD